jgi:hypothetical protein
MPSGRIRVTGDPLVSARHECSVINRYVHTGHIAESASWLAESASMTAAVGEIAACSASSAATTSVMCVLRFTVPVTRRGPRCEPRRQGTH